MPEFEGKVPELEQINEFLVKIGMRKKICNVNKDMDINNHPIEGCEKCEAYCREIPPEVLQVIKKPEKCGALLIYKTLMMAAAATLSRHEQ